MIYFQIGDLIISQPDHETPTYWHVVYVSGYGTSNVVQLVSLNHVYRDTVDKSELRKSIQEGEVIYAPVQVQQTQI